MPDDPHRAEDGASTFDGPGALSRLLQEIAKAPSDEIEAAWKEQLRPGAKVGRFEIRSEIGRGGFGSVYAAFDPELGRDVALKALRPHRSGAALSAEWINKEAEAVAKLNHPAIVTLHDVGTCPAGPYLVMELLRGETLAARLERGPLPLDEALRVADEMARGLAHAHERGVLHRDLKPANAFVCEDGRVKILDFGLAHLLGSERGSSGGTPAFMAPEQARGDTVDERADVYALGVVLFQLITGKLPYDLATERGVPPGGESPEIPKAPAPLVKILGRLLARDPAERMANGQEAHAALAALRKAREPKRALKVAWSLAALAVGVALAAALWPRPAPLPPGRLTVAMADTANLTGEPALEGLSGMLAKTLEQSPRVSLLPRALVLARSEQQGIATAPHIDAAAALRAARASKAQVALSLQARPVADGIEIEARGVDAAQERPLFTVRERTGSTAGIPDALDRISDRIRQGLDEDLSKAPPPVRLARIVSPNPEAWEAYMEGQRLAAEGQRGKANEAYLRAVAVDPGFPLPHVELAQASEFHDRSAVESHIQAALRHPDRIPPKDRRLVEARSADVNWDWTRAMERYDQVIAGWPDAPEAYVQAGRVASEVYGDPGMARPYLEKVIELQTTSPVERIQALEGVGRLDDALSEARRFAESKPGRPSLSLLSWIHRVRAEPAEALDAARRAMAFGKGPPNEMLFWSFVEGDALDEMGSIYEHRTDRPVFTMLGIHGRRKEALAAYDSRRPPPTAPLLSQGQFHNLRADFLAWDRDLEALWGEVTAQLLLGSAIVSCEPVLLAWVGDLERAERIDQLFPMLDARNSCKRAYLAIRLWRRGDPAAGVQALAGIDVFAVGYFRGEMLLELGRDREAVEEFRRYRRFPNRLDGTVFALRGYPESLYLEAVALDRLGERDQAVAALDRLLRIWKHADPDLPTLREVKVLRMKLTRPQVKSDVHLR